MRFEIKLATIKNLKDIQKLNLMLLEKEYDEYDKTLDCDWSFSKEAESYFRKRITKNTGCAFVAYIDNKVVAYLVGGIKEKDSCRKLSTFAELESMFVLEKYRGTGIGTGLYKSFIDWCATKNIKRLRIMASAENIRTIKFYKKCGLTDYDLILETDL